MRTRDMSAVILAGGRSTRMGENKLHLPLGEMTVIGQLISTVSALFEELIIVSNECSDYRHFPVKIIGDAMECQQKNSLIGIYSGLAESSHSYVFVVAGDMPFVRPELVTALCDMADGYDVTIPQEGRHFQPLCAVYHKNCLPHLEKLLLAGSYKITDFFAGVQVNPVPSALLSAYDRELLSFFNVNTPEEYRRACELIDKRK